MATECWLREGMRVILCNCSEDSNNPAPRGTVQSVDEDAETATVLWDRCDPCHDSDVTFQDLVVLD
jgi:CDGSH-type Zn-finger protein